MSREQSSAQDAEAGWEPRRDSREERAVRQEPDGREFLIMDRETVNMRSRRGRLMDQRIMTMGIMVRIPSRTSRRIQGKRKIFLLLLQLW